MGSYTVVDLLGFYKINDKVRLNLDVKNVFDRDYEEGAFGNVYAYRVNREPFKSVFRTPCSRSGRWG
jgi:outer membrane receptor protein involved in Fe transport